LQKQTRLIALIAKTKPFFNLPLRLEKIILDEVILAFPDRILNLHPGLVPDTTDSIVKNPDGTSGLWNKGMWLTKLLKTFLKQGLTFAGSSIHFLTLDFDFGPVLGRTFEKIQPGDTVDSLYARLKTKENQLYVEILQKINFLMA